MNSTSWLVSSSSAFVRTLNTRCEPGDLDGKISSIQFADVKPLKKCVKPK